MLSQQLICDRRSGCVCFVEGVSVEERRPAWEKGFFSPLVPQVPWQEDCLGPGKAEGDRLTLI